MDILIMAGGKGTRFWPLSTEKRPKQFLKIIGNKTMIQMTVERVTKLVSLNHIYICTSDKYVDILREQLPQIPLKNIIVEPEGRNTAPCILLSTLYIENISGSTNIIVLPSDHLIKDEDKFINVLDTANKYLSLYNNEAIVTLGIKPTRPETGYGYIKAAEKERHVAGNDIYNVDSFVEKPNIDLAKEYIKSGDFFWNAGMFIYNSKAILKLYQKYYSEGFKILSNLNYGKKSYYTELKENYSKCKSISVDYAIMENCDSLYVIPTELGWDDIGSWNALSRYMKKDGKENILKGNIKTINASHNIVLSDDDGEIILIDCEDLYCIKSNGKIYLGKKNKLNLISELKDKYEFD